MRHHTGITDPRQSHRAIKRSQNSAESSRTLGNSQCVPCPREVALCLGIVTDPKIVKFAHSRATQQASNPGHQEDWKLKKTKKMEVRGMAR